eukprot:5887981-Amphidinium_carterae.1
MSETNGENSRTTMNGTSLHSAFLMIWCRGVMVRCKTCTTVAHLCKGFALKLWAATYSFEVSVPCTDATKVQIHTQEEVDWSQSLLAARAS